MLLILFLIVSLFSLRYIIILLLIGGDLNCIFYLLDKLNCTAIPSGDKNALALLKSDFSLDVWRKRNPRKTIFTWFNGDLTQASKIDLFFLIKYLVPNVASSEI